MKIFNTKVYGLKESLIASGYPMALDIPDMDGLEVDFLTLLKRGKLLGTTKQGSGEDCFLKGILVQMDVRAPQYIWQQLKRYHWFDFVSSQSTMHRIVKMDIKSQCNEYVEPEVIEAVERRIRIWEQDKTDENFERIISNIPSGLELTARISTNYLQVKTMRNQRKHHKMSFYKKAFLPWCDSLPYFLDLTQKVV